MQELLNQILQESQGYGLLFEPAYVTTADTFSRTVTVSPSLRTALIDKVLIAGNYFPKKNDRGLLIYLGKYKYPAFIPEYFEGIVGEYNSFSFGTTTSGTGDTESNKRLILDTCQKLGVTDINQIAYILATVDWECNFVPRNEDAGANKPYAPYFGRGFVQITGKDNYIKFTNILTQIGTPVDLVNNPDKVNELNISAFILVYGMKYGEFTGFKLSDFINEDKLDFNNARKIVNPNELTSYVPIGDLARKYLTELNNVR